MFLAAAFTHLLVWSSCRFCHLTFDTPLSEAPAEAWVPGSTAVQGPRQATEQIPRKSCSQQACRQLWLDTAWLRGRIGIPLPPCAFTFTYSNQYLSRALRLQSPCAGTGPCPWELHCSPSGCSHLLPTSPRRRYVPSESPEQRAAPGGSPTAQQLKVRVGSWLAESVVWLEQTGLERCSGGLLLHSYSKVITAH